MSLTDPSGFSWFSKHWKKVTHFFKKYWREIVAIVVTVVITVATLGTGTGFWLAVAKGAMAGAIYAGTATALYGGDLGQIFSAALSGAVRGGIAAAIGYGIGTMYGAGTESSGTGTDFGWDSLGPGTTESGPANLGSTGLDPVILRGIDAARDAMNVNNKSPHLLVGSGSTLYPISQAHRDIATEYLRVSIPRQAASPPNMRKVEQFGRLYSDDGQTFEEGWPMSGNPDQLGYGPKPAPGAVIHVKNTRNAKPEPIPVGNGKVAAFDVHLHPRQEASSIQFSPADMNLAPWGPIDIYIGNMDGDLAVFPAAMPFNGRGNGIILCRGCVLKK